MNYKFIDNKNDWDKFIIQSGIATSFFQSWNWGEFQVKQGFKVIRIGFFDDTKQFGAAQGIVINAKRGKYLYVRNGPVANWDQDHAEFIINSLKQIARENNLWHIRLSPHIEKNSPRSIFLKDYPISQMADVDALDTWILDLDKTKDELLNNMRKSTRYEIRRAEKLGVKIIKSINAADIEKFYPIYEDTVKRQKWTGYSKTYIRDQFETFLNDNSALLYFAEYENKLIATSIFIYYGNSSYYHYSGSLTESKKIPGPYLIQWENIKEAKNRGLKRYNFWGITPEGKENHPWSGLSFFKMGFGGFAERWLETRDIPVNFKYYFTYFIETLDKIRKGY